MKQKEKIAALAHLAEIMKQAELGQLSRVAAARAETQAQLRALGDSHLVFPDDPTTAIVAEHHELWRVQRRATLNQQLARQTAEFLDARQRATEAFGRNMVLSRLAGKNN